MNSFDVKFNISNGLLGLENMNYTLLFNSLDTSDHYLLQQDFEVNYPEESNLLPFRNMKDVEFLIFSNHTLNIYFDGKTYYNTNGRTDKLEIVYKIQANGQWYTSIYSTNIPGNEVTSFNISQFMLNNQLTILQDFAVEYIIIGNNSELIVNEVSMISSASNKQVQEFYKIIDNEMGIVSDWIELNSSAISYLDDLDDLPSNFSIQYKVIDIAGNVGINSTYNGGYKNIIYSKQVSVSLDDDEINLNSKDNREISFINVAQFNNVPDLDVFINGFRYGTAYLDSGSYKLSFGTKNSRENLLAYSESILSDNIYSNVNPLSRISWDVRNENYFATVKHVLAGDSITITNPLLFNSTRNLDLSNLYNTNFGLPDFVRMQEAYYYNITSGEKYVLLENIDYFVHENGIVDFSQYSIVHDLYNNITDVQDGTVFFTYHASEFRDQLKLSNADGFFINFTMPEVFFDHTSIGKLTINFYDTNGETYSKVLFDIDLRKYFLDDVKSQYEKYIFGLGRMMAIPLYVDINELDFSNPYNTFDLGLLESISFTIEDSQQWPGSFIQNFANYSVINLPYQRVGILDLKLYNLISDSIDADENGYVNSTIEFRAPGYYNLYGQTQFKIKRLNVEFTDLKVYAYNGEVMEDTLFPLEYSDRIELNYRWNSSLSSVLMNDIYQLPVTLNNASSSETDVFGFSIANWIGKTNRDSLSGYLTKYYYSQFSLPEGLRIYNITFGSLGTPIFNISFIKSPSYLVNVTQESLLATEPIYLPENEYELEYGDSLLLEGVVRDNDQYHIEDEVYVYNYQEALDGETTHQLEIVSPFGDNAFVDKDELAIYYVNDRLETLPLYSTLNGRDFKNDTIIDYYKDPQISYVDNSYILTINWIKNATNFINYNTYLLISYKVLKGRPISPLSFSSQDIYGNDRQQNLIEIPFAKYDMLNDNWVTQETFSQQIRIDKVLMEVDFSGTSTTIQGPMFDDGQVIQTGIINIESVYENKSTSNTFELLNETLYSWSINANGELEVSGLPYVTGDVFKITYYAYYPISLSYSLNHAESNIDYIRVVNNSGYTYDFVSGVDYKLSEDGYKVYFLDLYNSILKSNNFTIYDKFEMNFTAPLTQRVDLSQNVLLMLQDSLGNDIPIDIIPLDNLGFFEYEEELRVDSPLSLPLGGSKRRVNLLLSYLPLSVYNKSSESLISLSYTDPDVGFIYPYAEANNWAKPVTIITIPDPVKLTMVSDPSQNIVISQKHYDERVYNYNYNPLETLGEGEAYTKVIIDAIVKEDYTFTYKLTNSEDKPINNSVVWLQIGLTPKAETGYINERMVLDDLQVSPYFEALGTEEVTFRGPGEYPNKLYGRPITYEMQYLNTNYSAYGPYYWIWSLTDEFGEATFDVSFNHDYINDFTNIFGSREGFSSVEDVVLYTRAFSASFDWDDFTIDSPYQYIASKDGNVFDGSTALISSSIANSKLQGAAITEGIIRLYKKHITVGTNDHYSYKLPDANVGGRYDPLTLNLQVAEAVPIPSGAFPTIDSLSRDYTSSELEALPINLLKQNHTYYANIDFYSPANNLVQPMYKSIYNSFDSGVITIDNETIKTIIDKLGPGISTIKIQVAESESYKASPVIIVPLEIVPENYVRFGKKNSEISLIDPFVSSWGSAFNDGEEMPFESSYPNLMGSIWIEPFYNATGSELSIQDYIDINLDATIYNDDGTTSTFPLRSNIMLRPGNQDGIMTFKASLGPEDAFLMGLQVDLNLSFNIDFNRDQIYKEQRDIDIYLLDLRLEANPSTNNPITTWSIYDNQFSSSTITVSTVPNTITTQKWVQYLGGTQNGQEYGQEIAFLFNNNTWEYGIDSNSELLNLLALTEIVALKVNGIKDGDNYEFIQGTDWIMPYYPSGILANDSVIEFSGLNLPDEGTELTVTYKLKFDFGSNYYGKVSLGYSNDKNESSIELQLPAGFLPESSDSLAPMFTRFTDRFVSTVGQTEFNLDYGLNGISSWNDAYFIIYNEQELNDTYGSFTKGVTSGHPKITFSSAPPTGSLVNITYGVKSQYDLSYGFQKIGKSFSDSVRTIHNNYASPKIIDELDNQLSTYTFTNSSLYISLDNSSEKTMLKLMNLPLLFDPEIILNFTFDGIILDLIESFGDDFNNLTIESKYITNDGYYEFYSDPLIIPLNYSDISGDIVNNLYWEQYVKDIQAIYDMVGADSVDIEITLYQDGNSLNFIPYVILEGFTYLSDTHIVENYDRMPLDTDGNFDGRSVINTPHYYQVFSEPFIDGIYGDSPFDLMDGAEVTIGIKDLPNSTLVSLDNYNFTDLGDSETISVSATNFYMIPNLGLFSDTYNIDETLYQDGYLDLYYGSGTVINGEKQYTKSITMDYESGSIADYRSLITDYTPTSWENIYNFTNKFITTGKITVEGKVFYHQIFDLDVDINSSSIMDNIFPDYEKNIYFGVQLPDNFDVDDIKAVGSPYTYSLSVQGFPVGKYKDEYVVVDTADSGAYTPSSNILTADTDYKLEFDENGTAYILFFRPVIDLSTYTDAQNKLMVDYWINHEFAKSSDYLITEVPEDPFNSQIEWDYSFVDINTFHLHPDFTSTTNYSVEFTALEWEVFNQDYINDGEDIFTFRPVEQYNISVLYTGETSTDIFSVQYIVPQGQYLEDFKIFPTLYTLIQNGDDEGTMKVFEIPNYEAFSYISQNAPNSYNYTIDYNEIENFIQTMYNPNYNLVDDSYIYILAEYNSTLLTYPMGHTPFNYEYLGPTHSAYHIALYIDDTLIAYSNETAFDDYVSKIEDEYLFFNNKSRGQAGFIDPSSSIRLLYKFKLQPGLLDRKNFMIVTYPWTNSFETIMDSLNSEDSQITFREKYRKLSGGSVISQFEYGLSIDNKYSLYLSYRLNQREYFEDKFVIDVQYYDPIAEGYVYEFMSIQLDNYIDVLEYGGEDSINVYYFDTLGQMQFLDTSHYIVDVNLRKITIKDDQNVLVYNVDVIPNFYVSFVPANIDTESASYRFSYDPSLEITATMDVNYWDVIGVNELDVIPNLDAYYFLNEQESTLHNTVSHASQIAAYLSEGNELEFDLEAELGGFDQDIIDDIHAGKYLSLYLDTNIQNIDSLDLLTVKLYDNGGLMDVYTQNISVEELIMNDNTIKVNLPTSTNTLKKIRLIPVFRTDKQYSQDNTIGIAQFQTIEWDSTLVSTNSDGNEYMQITLEHDLKTELGGLELAYVFNDKLQHLSFPYNITYILEEYSPTIKSYILYIPSTYIHPDTSETVSFQEGEVIVLRYNSPVKTGISIGVGNLYLENKGYNYEAHTDIPKAEILLVNASADDAYSEFTTGYYYQTPIQLTPFNTEYNNRYSAVKIDLNFTSLYESTGSTVLNFTHIVISVPNPTYELTINEVVILQESYEPTTQDVSFDGRV
ncbi:hypothetical protein LCGC14_0705920 [marine sediment metagenome]|uniref:Uncharacterized protein n=1 Tax=marine sediment metagenome TaxID=412755 RepID=A0A0F9T2E7_9ZZZZ